MSPEDLHLFTRRQPFEPFRIVLTDGKTYDVRHPDMLIATRRTAAIGVPSEASQPTAERIVTVSLLHIVRLEPIDAATPA